MNRFKKVSVLVPMVLGLSLFWTGEIVADREAPAGIVAAMVLEVLVPAPLAAQQLVCGYCHYDPESGERMFISIINCNENGGGVEGASLGDESGCRVCIDEPHMLGGESASRGSPYCEFNTLVLGECPEFTCGPGGGDINRALLASARGDWAAVESFALHFHQHVRYDPVHAAFVVTSCTQTTPVHVPASPRAALLVALARLGTTE